MNSLNHPTNSCNAVVAGEAAMMGKQHLIATFGVPPYTMSTHGSRCAYTTLPVSGTYPGPLAAAPLRPPIPTQRAAPLVGPPVLAPPTR